MLGSRKVGKGGKERGKHIGVFHICPGYTITYFVFPNQHAYILHFVFGVENRTTISPHSFDLRMARFLKTTRKAVPPG